MTSVNDWFNISRQWIFITTACQPLLTSPRALNLASYSEGLGFNNFPVSLHLKGKKMEGAGATMRPASGQNEDRKRSDLYSRKTEKKKTHHKCPEGQMMTALPPGHFGTLLGLESLAVSGSTLPTSVRFSVTGYFLHSAAYYGTIAALREKFLHMYQHVPPCLHDSPQIWRTPGITGDTDDVSRLK